MKSTEWAIKNKIRQFSRESLFISTNPTLSSIVLLGDNQGTSARWNPELSLQLNAYNDEFPWDLRVRISSPWFLTSNLLKTSLY